jgi:hypothetical protein
MAEAGHLTTSLLLAVETLKQPQRNAAMSPPSAHAFSGIHSVSPSSAGDGSGEGQRGQEPIADGKVRHLSSKSPSTPHPVFGG